MKDTLIGWKQFPVKTWTYTGSVAQYRQLIHASTRVLLVWRFCSPWPDQVSLLIQQNKCAHSESLGKQQSKPEFLSVRTNFWVANTLAVLGEGATIWHLAAKSNPPQMCLQQEQKDWAASGTRRSLLELVYIHNRKLCICQNKDTWQCD